MQCNECKQVSYSMQKLSIAITAGRNLAIFFYCHADHHPRHLLYPALFFHREFQGGAAEIAAWCHVTTTVGSRREESEGSCDTDKR